MEGQTANSNLKQSGSVYVPPHLRGSNSGGDSEEPRNDYRDNRQGGGFRASDSRDYRVDSRGGWVTYLFFLFY